MKISEMTRKEFKEVPARKKFNQTIICDSIVLLPVLPKEMHDSGFRVMDFVAVDILDEPICRLSGCSDVLEVNWFARNAEGERWAIDCLDRSGLLRLFCHNYKIVCNEALSSFQLYTKPRG